MMLRTGTVLAAVMAMALPTGAQDERMEKDFKKALTAWNEREIESVARELVLQGSEKNARLILSHLGFAKSNPEETDCYWIVVSAAAAFQTVHGLQEVAKYIVDKRKTPEAKDLVSRLHNNFSVAAEHALVTIVQGCSGADELRVSALDHLIDFAGKPAVDGMIEFIRKEKDLGPEVASRVYDLLSKVTEQQLGESAANWISWWDANKDKFQVKAGGGAATPPAGPRYGERRQKEYDKLKEARVLIIHAGDACKCKRNHDLDTGIDRLMAQHEWKTEKMTKNLLDNEQHTGESLFREYVGIIAICTHIREHCCCPNCKPGKEKVNLRLYKCEGCNVHDTFAFKLSKKATGKIKDYVDRGGYLFAEDWAMEDLIEPEWGNLVRHSKYLPEQEVSVLPKPGMGTHPYLRKIFVKPPNKRGAGGTSAIVEDVARLDYTYKIDADAPAISIGDRKKVTVLMFSETLAAQSESENGSDAVTITWESGTGGGAVEDNSVRTGGPAKPMLRGGRVIYTLAHFGKQPQTSGGEKGDYALTNLLINFLLEANERRVIRARR